MLKKLFVLCFFIYITTVGVRVAGYKLKNPKKKLPVSQIAQETANDLGGSVLGAATHWTSEAVSKSKGAAEDFVLHNAVDTLTDQFEKLPKKQKEEIKDNICK